MLLKYLCFLIVSFISLGLFAQDVSISKLESLEDEELLTLFIEVEKDSLKAEKVARVYLNRARKQKDTIKMARGYDRLARIFSPQKSLQFADSIIFLTKDIENITFPCQGYLLKSYEYSLNNNLKKSIESLYIAYDLSLQNKNITQQIFILDKLLLTLSDWGNKKDALIMQKKRDSLKYKKDFLKNIFKSTRKGAERLNEDLEEYHEISSLFNFSYCYLRLRKLDSAEFYANKGLQKRFKYKGELKARDTEVFLELLVEIYFHKNDYQKAINLCDELISKPIIKNYLPSLQNLYFFKGQSLLKMNNEIDGIKNLIKADSIFDNNNFVINRPFQKVLFELLLDYYKKVDDINSQVHYLNKLIKADSLIIENYKYFEPSLIKNFETPKLIQEKERLLAKVTQESANKEQAIYSMAAVLAISLLGSLYYFRRQQVFKTRFLTLMEQKAPKNKIKIEIPIQIIHHLLEGLEAFENQKEYLSSNITLTSLAKSLGTNKSYLSHTINFQKGKRFSDYINNLRVQHVLILLKDTPKYRKYTIKAIAQECGFKSGESFSKTFYKNYGIYPSYYIKQLEQSKKKIA